MRLISTCTRSAQSRDCANSQIARNIHMLTKPCSQTIYYGHSQIFPSPYKLMRLPKLTIPAFAMGNSTKRNVIPLCFSQPS